MSHVRRKRPRQPVRAVRKKRNKSIQWLAILLLSLMLMGVIIGITFVILSSP